MLTLYYKPTCAHSVRVLGEAEVLGISFNLKDISSDHHLAEELIIQGGKEVVPFLIDTEKGVKLYESEAIVAHLLEHYKDAQEGRTFGGLRVHQSDEICDTCQ